MAKQAPAAVDKPTEAVETGAETEDEVEVEQVLFQRATVHVGTEKGQWRKAKREKGVSLRVFAIVLGPIWGPLGRPRSDLGSVWAFSGSVRVVEDVYPSLLLLLGGFVFVFR